MDNPKGDPGQPIVMLVLMATLAASFGGVSGWALKSRQQPTVVTIPGPPQIVRDSFPVPGPPVAVPGPVRIVRDSFPYPVERLVTVAGEPPPPDTVFIPVDRWHPAEVVWDTSFVLTPRNFWDFDGFRPRAGTLSYGLLGLGVGYLVGQATNSCEGTLTLKVR